ncbi:MAG: glycosyltransferase family 4 protein [Bacteroidia bacterium]|nr:glycosyltransferase family 4 protein [Bacteroidia bacterium]
MFIGRISNTKGLDFIYTALSKLKKLNLNFKFIMAGAGPQQNEYVQKFASLLGNNFEFKGVVSGQTKTALYQSCHVFLLPSLFEGLPMSLLEAMSFGLVPVVTKCRFNKYSDYQQAKLV